ncbi:hypothetical protein PB2503_13494 [Parvularcula bermudensis HTCC2503]|uniref:Uncharacterized protein n=1 Tax=Parvularcula bermudensis (strain ATCC BAA-594 / HTCC2503 / KCTC 12087) TaxID=314260 RepID=E0THE4_PARBH|nr:hypothetical protein [Parvularcula bermudensis]ADM10736.1 hypothetical protein PB2503_13494 [Parvularcula bermudensis HTCC2503]
MPHQSPVSDRSFYRPRLCALIVAAFSTVGPAVAAESSSNVEVAVTEPRSVVGPFHHTMRRSVSSDRVVSDGGEHREGMGMARGPFHHTAKRMAVSGGGANLLDYFKPR